MRGFVRFLRALPLVVVSPFLAAISFAALILTDLAWLLAGRKRPPRDTMPSRHAASVVIPTWNARDLLEKYLPPLIEALEGNPGHEIIVVDNGSSDGSADFVRQRFPGVRVLALPRNLGFGGGANAGVRAARNDIVVLLNNDIRVDRDFLPSLLEGFQDAGVFAVACQIFFSDPGKVREETGLTQGWWENGSLRVRHRIDEGVKELYPCFYGGGGSSAFDRRKFLELGGFDKVFEPFYCEDTDLGYRAWKRGWKVLYQPRSEVYHEHRGTIGRRFSEERIRTVLKKNFLLFAWKNVHEVSRLGSHFVLSYSSALVSLAIGDSPERSNLAGFWHAFLQLPAAMASRWRARALAVLDDTETLRRPMGGYFRDRFHTMERAPEKLRVLFVSPYPICPPVHGGGVFMYQTLLELVKHAEVHLIVLIDEAWQRGAHDELVGKCASAEFVVRARSDEEGFGSLTPHAITEYSSRDLEWLIHRQICTREIDVVQLEYTPLSQYAGAFRRIPCILFEHDIYFQSIARGMGHTQGIVRKAVSRFEYLRALRYELRTLSRMDRVQVCSRDNREYLLSFLPRLAGRIDDDLRAGIDTSRYDSGVRGRRPWTMLFLGGFRHPPNQSALAWFTQSVLPRVVHRRPEARLVVVGSEPPPPYFLPEAAVPFAELRGYVDDVRAPLAECAVFVCPVLIGSGMRVKLLEAFAAGIPVVSTRLGAEGLAREDGEFCALADDPAEFAEKILALFDNPEAAAAMAARARTEVETRFDMAAMTRKLAESYRKAVLEKRV